jgi:hypothetical protein
VPLGWEGGHFWEARYRNLAVCVEGMYCCSDTLTNSGLLVGGKTMSWEVGAKYWPVTPEPINTMSREGHRVAGSTMLAFTSPLTGVVRHPSDSFLL